MIEEPVLIKELSKPIDNTRKYQMDNDDGNRFLGGKGLVLKQHYTDKDRCVSLS